MKVVVAVDDTPASCDLVKAISRRHWPADTQFKLVSVIEPFDADDKNAELKWNVLLTDVNQRRTQRAEKICGRLRQLIMDRVPSSIVHFEIKHGDARDEIINSAAAWTANKILICARGRNVCPFNSLGTVSKAVARNANCSVEIVRRRHTAPREKLTNIRENAEVHLKDDAATTSRRPDSSVGGAML